MPTYRYIGTHELEYDDASDDYDLSIVMGDEFDMFRQGNIYVLHHAQSPEITFRLNLQKGNNLLKLSEERLTVRPDPSNPPYLLFDPDFEMVKPLYDYYNNLYFNGQCPVVKFRKTRSSKVWGLAKLEWYKGKPVFTMLVNESTMIDRKLFTNTIIHEMIHLYNFATGAKLWTTRMTPEDSAKALEHLHDDHGPLFQTQMHRINAHGFRIILAGTHEEIQHKASDDFYAILAVNENMRTWTSWYTHQMMDDSDIQKVAALYRTQRPHESVVILLVKTKNREVTYGTNLKTGRNFSLASMDKVNKGNIPADMEVVKKAYVYPATKVELPDYKDEAATYAMPFNRFLVAMKRVTNDQAVLRDKWRAFPVKYLNKEIEAKFKSLIGMVRRRAAKEADIMNHIQDIRDSYDDRVKFPVYEAFMRKLLDTWDKNGVMVEYHSFLGLR